MTKIEGIIKEVRELNTQITKIKGEIYRQYECLQTARLTLSRLETDLEDCEQPKDDISDNRENRKKVE